MSQLQSIRSSARAIALCAIAVTLLFALPALARPQAVQAQGCGGFSVAGSSSLGCSGSGYGSGCGAFVSSCGSYGSGYGGYGGSIGCTGLFGSCQNGVGGIGGGQSCVGLQLTAGESCSNGQVLCPPTAGGQMQTCSPGGYASQGGSSCPANVSSSSCAASYNPNCQPNISSSLCPGGYQASTASAGVNGSYRGNAVGSNPVVGENYGTSSYGGSSSTGSSGTGSDALISCGSYGQVPASSCPGNPAATGGGATNSNLSFGGSSSGLTIIYPSGWNIVAGPQGTSFGSASGSLYTMQSGDSTYETASLGGALKAGDGYWLYSSGVQATIPSTPGASASVQLPAGQWILVGDPGSTVATVTGADQVLVYNPMSGSYTQTTQLQPGQGGWAMSNAGGSATITGS